MSDRRPVGRRVGGQAGSQRRCLDSSTRGATMVACSQVAPSAFCISPQAPCLPAGHAARGGSAWQLTRMRECGNEHAGDDVQQCGLGSLRER